MSKDGLLKSKVAGAIDVLLREDQTGMSRYFNPIQGICIVVARNATEAILLSQHYDAIVNGHAVADMKKEVVVSVPMSPIILTGEDGN